MRIGIIAILDQTGEMWEKPAGTPAPTIMTCLKANLYRTGLAANNRYFRQKKRKGTPTRPLSLFSSILD
jgi:hypothetical protein